MRSTRARLAASVLALALAGAAGLVAAQGAGGSRPDAGPAVARVAGYTIPAGELEMAQRQFEPLYERDLGRKLTAAERTQLERGVLEQLVRQRLLRAEAKRRNLAVPDTAVERLLQRSGPFQGPTGFDVARWETFKANPSLYQTAMQDGREVLAAQRLYEQQRARLTPTEAAVAARAAQRRQGAEVHVLPLDTTWFEPGLEIRADSLRAHYRALADRFSAPARVRLGLAVVTPPAEAGAAAPSATALTRARARADSLLAAVRAGTPFDSVAAGLGGERDGGWWVGGQTTGLFFEDLPLGELALAAAPGTTLERPLKVPAGYALVRVADQQPARVLPHAQVADSVARDYRRVARERGARADVEAVRAAHPESFRTVCTSWRAALVDTGRVTVKEPGDGKLRKWYRENGSGFARLDAAGSGVTQPPYSEVAGAVRERYLALERWRVAEETGRKIAEAWKKGRRDQRAEATAQVWYELRTDEFGGAPAELPPALGDSARAAAVGAARTFPAAAGVAVYAVSARDSACALSPEWQERVTAEILTRQRQERAEADARAYFESHPREYLTEPTYHATFLHIQPRPHLITDLPKAAVERYYREHPEEFGQPEEVRLRHLLVRAPAGPDTAAAYAKALQLLAAARAGADFDSLVRAESADPTTRDQGGDTGWIRRGMTPRVFETLAFSLRPGEFGGPLRSPAGYSLLQCVEKKEERISPFNLAQGIAGDKVARQWADSLAYAGAESLHARAKSPRDFERYVRERGYFSASVAWLPGTTAPMPFMNADLQREARALGKPGLLPGIYLQSDAYYVVFLDSLSAPGPATWEMAAERALADQRRRDLTQQAERALAAVSAELAAGAPWDSAAAPWGGGLSFAHRRGSGLPGIPDAASADSALYGSPAVRLSDGGATVLAQPRGATLLQLVQRETPPPLAAAERDAFRDAMAERAFYEYFEQLKKRFPVSILRADLRTELPAPPAP
jgi:parvulin-like peptidyl-prolyl isomerase